jgi:hypothetical protein
MPNQVCSNNLPDCHDTTKIIGKNGVFSGICAANWQFYLQPLTFKNWLKNKYWQVLGCTAIAFK